MEQSVSFFEIPDGWTPPCNGKWADGSGTSDLGNMLVWECVHEESKSNDENVCREKHK